MRWIPAILVSTQMFIKKLLNMKEEKEMRVTSLQRFFEENSNVCIRAQVINGEPWFVAKDLCQALDIKNSRDTLKKVLDDDESDVDTIYTRSYNGVIQKREVSIVNESGLYHLIFISRKPEAITKEVLPTLRKTGIYALQGSLLRNGVDGILYKDTKLYPYKEMLLALGFSNGSGAARKRKKTYSTFFVKAFGRIFIKEEMVVYLEEERKQANRRLAMRKQQLELPFSMED